MVDVLRDQLASLGVPVLGGLPVGHPEPGPTADQLAVSIGPVATLDVEAGTLEAGACVR